MMKNNKKKGFTIVELVIVIAVIAILAAVLIPTFSNVVDKANKSATLLEARSKYTALLADDMEDGVQNGKINATTNVTVPTDCRYTVEVSGETTTISFKYNKRGYTAVFNGSDWNYVKEATISD